MSSLLNARSVDTLALPYSSNGGKTAGGTGGITTGITNAANSIVYRSVKRLIENFSLVFVYNKIK